MIIYVVILLLGLCWFVIYMDFIKPTTRALTKPFLTDTFCKTLSEHTSKNGEKRQWFACDCRYTNRGDITTIVCIAPK